MAFCINLVLGRIHLHNAPKKTKQKGTSGYMVALGVLLPMDGLGSWEPQCSASPWLQQGLAARAVPLLSHCPSQEWDSAGSPGHWALPWGQGWAAAGTGHPPEGGVRSTSVSYMLPGWGMAVAQLEWQLWDNPALNQALTVTVLERLRAQLILFLFNGAV